MVAAESFWGSIAAQLGGAHATVQSIVQSPAIDPHSYEPTASDARKLAVADVAVVNGIGYDRWASQLLAANPSDGRIVIDAGKVLGLGDGANPHQWYSPTSVPSATDLAKPAGVRRSRWRLRPSGSKMLSLKPTGVPAKRARIRARRAS